MINAIGIYVGLSYRFGGGPPPPAPFASRQWQTITSPQWQLITDTWN